MFLFLIMSIVFAAKYPGKYPGDTLAAYSAYPLNLLVFKHWIPAKKLSLVVFYGVTKGMLHFLIRVS